MSLFNSTERTRRSQLKYEYKQKEIPMGIYQIKNKINGKIFIGGSPNIQGKLNGIRFSLEHGSFINKELQKEWNEYGPESFSFETLDILKPDQNKPNQNYYRELQVLEELWLERLKPYDDRGYNRIVHSNARRR